MALHIEGDAVWPFATNLLKKTAVMQWLRGEGAEELMLPETKSMNYSVIPCDFLGMAPGPMTSVLETLQFSRSLFFRSHSTEDAAFVIVVLIENGKLRQNRVVLHYDHERKLFCGIRMNTQTEQPFLQIVQHKEEDRYETQFGALVVELGETNTFQVVDTCIIDRDCSFCNLRGRVCNCPPSLKRNLRAATRRNLTCSLDDKERHWRVGMTILGGMVGVSWFKRSTGSPQRVATEMNPADLPPRIQQLHGQTTSWKFLLRSPEKSDASPYIEGDAAQKKPRVEASDDASKHPSKFKCDLCGATFKFVYRLRRHRDGVHLGKKFSCRHCNKDFTQNSHLRTHVKNVHDKKTSTISCEQCGVCFEWKGNLIKHMKHRHPELET